MDKRGILELKKRFKKDATTVSRVCGCYVDADKNIVSTFNENFLGLPDEDLFKYLDILKNHLVVNLVIIFLISNFQLSLKSMAVISRSLWQSETVI